MLKRAAALLVGVVACSGNDPEASWVVTRQGTRLEISYGKEVDYPQFAALHLESGYFRLTYGPEGGWGTSIVLVPSFWEQGTLFQGSPVEASWSVREDQLVMQLQSTLSRLETTVELRLFPPSGDSIMAIVTAQTRGELNLDQRPGEAFKLVMLSSMRVSDSLWDGSTVMVGSETVAIPGNGWILNPPVPAARFAIQGGSSSWKPNAPTVVVQLEEPRAITGWVTPSTDPNDDNVALWATTDQVVRAWRYTVVARKP